MSNCFRERGDKSGRVPRVFIPTFPKFFLRFFFFMPRKPNIHNHQYRKHNKCKKCRPLEQESEHDENKTGILRMADAPIRTNCCERLFTPGFVQNFPRVGEQNKSIPYENVTHNMEWPEVRVAAPTKQVF